MKALHINKELDALLSALSAHVGLPICEVVRRTATAIRRGNVDFVRHLEIPEMLYASGDRVMAFRCRWADVPDAEFRKILAGRCIVELRKPKVSYLISYADQAGISRHYPTTPEELDAMIARGVKAFAVEGGGSLNG